MTLNVDFLLDIPYIQYISIFHTASIIDKNRNLKEYKNHGCIINKYNIGHYSIEAKDKEYVKLSAFD